MDGIREAYLSEIPKPSNHLNHHISSTNIFGIYATKSFGKSAKSHLGYNGISWNLS